MNDSTTLFDVACKTVTNYNPPQDIQLKLYALFKFVKLGPLNPKETPKPGLMNFTGRAKWGAYNDLTARNPNLTTEQAQAMYIETVEGVIGRKIVVNDNVENNPGAEDVKPPAQKKSSNQGMGPVASTLMEDTISLDVLNNSEKQKYKPLSESSRLLHDLCTKSSSENSTEEGVSISETITIQVNQNGAKCFLERDELGQSALHILMDEGSLDCIRTVCELARKEIEIELAEGREISWTDSDSVDPLCAALAAERDIDIVKCIVEVGRVVVTEEVLADCNDEQIRLYLTEQMK